MLHLTLTGLNHYSIPNHLAYFIQWFEVVCLWPRDLVSLAFVCPSCTCHEPQVVLSSGVTNNLTAHVVLLSFCSITPKSNRTTTRRDHQHEWFLNFRSVNLSIVVSEQSNSDLLHKFFWAPRILELLLLVRSGFSPSLSTQHLKWTCRWTSSIACRTIFRNPSRRWSKSICNRRIVTLQTDR